MKHYDEYYFPLSAFLLYFNLHIVRFVACDCEMEAIKTKYNHEKMAHSMLFTLKTSNYTEGKKESEKLITPLFLSFFCLFVCLFVCLFFFQRTHSAANKSLDDSNSAILTIP